MAQDLGLAEKCFTENLRLFANTTTEAEKYNLYTGLANLAGGLAAEVSSLKSEVRQLRDEVRRLESRRT
jgi:hypothetical protein